MTNLSQIAETYDRLGFSIIPLLKRSKKPTVSWKRYQSQRPALSQIQNWFSGDDLGIGIITGEVSNLCVIDIDDPKGHGWLVRQGGIDKTPWVKTARGWHIYMRYPKGSNFSKITPIDGMEIMGNGHYVAAPPSKHPSGKRYEWIYSPSDVALAEPRPWLTKLIKQSVSSSQKKGGRDKKWKGLRFSDKAIPPKKKFIPKITPAPDKEALRRQIFGHYIWKGEAKKGSNNGLFLTRLITHYRTGSDQEESISEVDDWCEGQVPYSKIKAASNVTWKRGYGLKPQVIEQVSELDYEESYAFTNLVASFDGWDSHQTKQKQLSPEVVTQRIVAATLLLNYKYTSLTRLSELIQVPYRTIYGRIKDGRLPWYIHIKTIPNKGIFIINLLPLLWLLLLSLTRLSTSPNATVMSPLSGKRGKIDNALTGSSDIPDT